MSNDKLSPETRASSAFVQGELEELLQAHKDYALGDCQLLEELGVVLLEWKQAEGELRRETLRQWLFKSALSRNGLLDPLIRITAQKKESK